MAGVAGSSAAANTSSLSAATGGGGGVVVVGPEYCSPYPLELAMKRESLFSSGFVITDVSNNNLLFRVEPFGFSKRKVRIFNAAGVPILTMKPKAWSWQVFMGEGSHLICTVKNNNGFFRIEEKVYLANNTAKNYCDFRIKKRVFEDSYKVYVGESKTAMIAEMYEPLQILGKGNKFVMMIQPNIDTAFIVALTVIRKR